MDVTKPEFLDPVEFTQKGDGINFTVHSTFRFRTNKDEIVIVEAPFDTDLASIPDFAIIGAGFMLVWMLFAMYWPWKLAKHVGMPVVIANFVLVLISGKLKHYGKYTNAAIVHDYLYKRNPNGWSRWYCDWVLNEAMGCCKVARWQRVVIYLGVVLCGLPAWLSHRHSRKDYRNRQ
jgi:hypothetical protein